METGKSLTSFYSERYDIIREECPSDQSIEGLRTVPQIQHIVCKAEEEHAGDGEEGCNKLYKLLNRLLALPRLSGINSHKRHINVSTSRREYLRIKKKRENR